MFNSIRNALPCCGCASLDDEEVLVSHEQSQSLVVNAVSNPAASDAQIATVSSGLPQNLPDTSGILGVPAFMAGILGDNGAGAECVEARLIELSETSPEILPRVPIHAANAVENLLLDTSEQEFASSLPTLVFDEAFKVNSDDIDVAASYLDYCSQKLEQTMASALGETSASGEQTNSTSLMKLMFALEEQGVGSASDDNHQDDENQENESMDEALAQLKHAAQLLGMTAQSLAESADLAESSSREQAADAVDKLLASLLPVVASSEAQVDNAMARLDALYLAAVAEQESNE